jgi:hypothetical protein
MCLAATIVGASTFLCGVAMAGLFFLSRAIWRLGRYPVVVTPHRFGVLSTGELLKKCFTVVALIWMVFSSCATGHMRARYVLLAFFAVPHVLFFLGAFVMCQLPLHKRMIESKGGMLLDLDKLQASLRPRQREDLTPERRQQLEFCSRVYREVYRLPEWPFDWRALTTVAVSGVTAIAPSIVKTIAHGFE